MGFKCGIVGLPNVGKSTLFNALTKTQAAEASNYPFCTIEPNIGRVSVPDERLNIIAKIAGSAQIIPTQLEFVDIAGLVRGASKGEGLGNKFLASIREMDAIIHVVRCFEDPNVTHVEGPVDPKRDIEIINTELMIADLESLERRKHNLDKKARGGDKEAKENLVLIERALKTVEEGKAARTLPLTHEELPLFKQLQLLTGKPILYVCNVNEQDAHSGNQFTTQVTAIAAEEGSLSVIISANIEAEIASLASEEEKREFLESLGLKETGLSQVIHEGYKLLDLVTFFTAGPKEARAWTVERHAKAPEAAGVIHSDFERGFIRAETISYDDFVSLGGEHNAKAAGKLRLEGKDYVVKDGDIFHFRFNI
jgi:GTP-binding protein YchF